MNPDNMEKDRIMNRPYPGDVIEMPSMGSDVSIVVRHVPDHQPRSDEEVYAIVDQYGETHFIELDGDTWVTAVQQL